MDYTKKYIKYKKKYFDLKQELEGGSKNEALVAVKQDGKALAGLSEELRGDKEVVLAAVQQNGEAFEYASNELKADRDFVLAVVKQNWLSLIYASGELRADKVVVQTAVQQEGWTIEFASDKLQNDKNFLIECYRLNKETSTFNYFIFGFANLENGIFDDTFIDNNVEILHLVENKEQLCKYLLNNKKYDIIYKNEGIAIYITDNYNIIVASIREIKPLDNDIIDININEEYTIDELKKTYITNMKSILKNNDLNVIFID